VPYGGYKQSGFGRTGGLEGLHEFLQVKNIRIGQAVRLMSELIEEG